MYDHGSGSREALTWAMDTMFLEWTLTSMCIYGLPAILFAFVFYNMKLPFSIGAMLAPAIGNERAKKLMPVVDVICLFGLQEGLRGFLNAGLVFVMAAVYASFANQITGAAWAIRLCAVLLLVIGVLCMVISAVLYRIVKKEKKTA